MPRKNPLPEREAGICHRLKLFREDLKLSRVAFASEAGIDSSLLVHYEHKRGPLKYESAWKIISAFPLNASWLAECDGREMLWIQIPSAEELHVSKNALFSEVYDSALRKFLQEKSAGIIESYEAAKKRPTHLLTMPDTKGRHVAENILFDRLSFYMAAIPDTKLNEFLEDVEQEIAKIWNSFPHDSAAIHDKRLRAIDLFRASWKTRLKMMNSAKGKKNS